MFKKLLNIITEENTSAELDSKVLFASLLVRAARIDNEYSNLEKLQIDKLLQKKFNLSELQVKEIRLEGERLESKTVDTVQITKEIKKDIPFEYRKALAKDLWSIILADNKRTDDESSFMRTCIKLIGLNDVDGAKARQEVLNHLNQKKDFQN